MDETAPGHNDDEISLLDMLVVIAESWMILLVAPILAGLAAFGVAQLQPRSFSSSAVLTMPQLEVEAALTDEFIAVAVGPRIAGPALSQIRSGLSTMPDSASRTALTLELADRNMVRPVLTSIAAGLDRTAGNEFLAGRRSEVEQRLGELEAVRATQERAIARLEASLRRLDEQDDIDVEAYSVIASALATLMAGTVELADAHRALQQELEAISTSIIREPPSPLVVIGPSPVRAAILTTIAIGFLVLVLVFVRAGLRTAAATPDGSAKMARIRRAFWLKDAPADPGKA